MKRQRKILWERARHRWEGNTKMNVGEIVVMYLVPFVDSQSAVATRA